VFLSPQPKQQFSVRTQRFPLKNLEALYILDHKR
jgi:hypothetical protein